jgi:hypothetical protein
MCQIGDKDVAPSWYRKDVTASVITNTEVLSTGDYRREQQ